MNDIVRQLIVSFLIVGGAFLGAIILCWVDEKKGKGINTKKGKRSR